MTKGVKRKLAAAFAIVDMGPISFYLELKIERDRKQNSIKLSQPVYIDKVLEKFHPNKANQTKTPMKETTTLSPNAIGEASTSKQKRKKHSERKKTIQQPDAFARHPLLPYFLLDLHR